MTSYNNFTNTQLYFFSYNKTKEIKTEETIIPLHFLVHVMYLLNFIDI